VVWLEQEWRTAAVTPFFQMRYPEATEWWGSPLYVCSGQALQWHESCWAVAESVPALDEIAQALGIVWECRW
jgi:hypothetical protein